MRLVSLTIVFLCLCCVCTSFDMIVGDTVHRKMVFHQRVKDFAIPFKKRIKSLTYNDPEKRIIKLGYQPCPPFVGSYDTLSMEKGVAAIDNDFSLASANITDGGVGSSYVSIRMKSQRHHPLNFEVEIYV